ncbi:hypothetical protein Tco_0470782, partial [Tanacetum coccineum]
IKISDSRLKAQHQFPAIDEVLCFFKHNLGHRFFLGYGGLPAWHRNRLVGGGNERNWVNDGLGKRVRPVSCDGGVFEEMAGKGDPEPSKSSKSLVNCTQMAVCHLIEGAILVFTVFINILLGRSRPSMLEIASNRILQYAPV